MIRHFRASLVGQLTVVFIVLASATAVLGGLLVHTISSGRDFVTRLENLRAQQALVEQINGLVYAVVMESRGVYMSDDRAVLARFATNQDNQLAALILMHFALPMHGSTPFVWSFPQRGGPKDQRLPAGSVTTMRTGQPGRHSTPRSRSCRTNSTAGPTLFMRKARLRPAC
jgi:hypothetical protein